MYVCLCGVRATNYFKCFLRDFFVMGLPGKDGPSVAASPVPRKDPTCLGARGFFSRFSLCNMEVSLQLIHYHYILIVNLIMSQVSSFVCIKYKKCVR
jgi:hypothetical protein